MGIIRFKRNLLTLLAICICVFANSQQPADSLLYYLEMATKSNPQVLQKFNEYQAAMQKVPQAGGLNDPELSIGVFLSPMEIAGGKQVADIRLMQMFPWFGVLKSAKDEMSLMARAKYQAFLDSKYQVYYEVEMTWYELYKIQEKIRISEENIELLRAIERISLAKFKAGNVGGKATSFGLNNNSGNVSQSSYSTSSGMNSMEGNSSASAGLSSGGMQSGSMSSPAVGTGLTDIYSIQIEIGDMENTIATLKNQKKTISARFNSFMNRPPDILISLPEHLVTETLEISLLSIKDSIQKNNPMLVMLKYEQQSIDARINMVSRMSYPMVGLGVNYSVVSKSEMSGSPMNGSDMIMPMVTATLPIYRKKYKATRSEAEFMRESANQTYQAASNTLQNECFEAMQLYEDSKRQMLLYERQSQLAQNTLDILIKRFSSDEAGLADVLKMRQQIIQYKFKSLEAFADYNTAVAWVKKLMAYQCRLVKKAHENLPATDYSRGS